MKRLLLILGILQGIIKVTVETSDFHREENDVLKLIGSCEWEMLTAADIAACMDKRNKEVEKGFGDTLPNQRQHRRKRVVKYLLKWPKHSDGFVYVPYEFSSTEFIPPQDVRDTFLSATKYIQNTSCIRFVPKKREDVNFIQVIDDGDGCYSYVGMQGGGQMLSLQSRTVCAIMGVAVHEILHALGFMHEMVRRDRSRYINVHYENIKPDQYPQFDMHDIGTASVYGEPYDVSSIMHYGNYAFSANGKKTLTHVTNESIPLGQRDGMSEKDKKQLNKMYKCEKFISRV